MTTAVDVREATTDDAAPAAAMPAARVSTALLRSFGGARTSAISFVCTVAAALVATVPILVVAGADPVVAYRAIVDGSLGDARAIGETLVAATPLLLAGLAVTVAFRAGIFNLGVEGQLVLGGLAAGAVGAELDLPAGLHVVAALAAAAAVGAGWAAVAGVLKAYRGVHEVISTIMLNYVAFHLSTYLVGPAGALASATQPRATERIASTAELARIWDGTRLHLGFVVALATAVVCGLFLFRTPTGYRFRMVGANAKAASFNGIRPRTVTIQAMALSGALAGLTGAVEVLGLHSRYFDAFSPGYGFDSIAVALLGCLHPAGVAVAAGFLGMLRAGSVQLQATAGVSRDVITVISGVIVAFVAARPFVERTIRRRRRRRRRRADEAR